MKYMTVGMEAGMGMVWGKGREYRGWNGNGLVKGMEYRGRNGNGFGGKGGNIEAGMGMVWWKGWNGEAGMGMVLGEREGI